MLTNTVSKESPRLQKFTHMLCSLPFLLGTDGTEAWYCIWDVLSRLVSSFSALVVSCTILGWISSFESFSPLPSGFLSRLWFGWCFECWHFRRMLCVERGLYSGSLLMKFSYHFPSFPQSSNQRYNSWKFSRYGCKLSSKERMGTLPTSSALAVLFEFPYENVFWSLCNWTEGKHLLECRTSVLGWYFSKEKTVSANRIIFAQLPHVVLLF